MRTLYFLALFWLTTGSLYAQKQSHSDLLEVEEMKADIDLLWEGLNTYHPGLYLHRSENELLKIKNNLKSSITEPISRGQWFLKLSGFTHEISCGHTYPNPYNQPDRWIQSVYQEPVLLPFTFLLVDQQMIVTESLVPGITQGDIVSSIGGIDANEIIDTLIPYVKGDGNRDETRRLDLATENWRKYKPFDYLFPLHYSFKDSVIIELAKNDHALYFPLITDAQRQKLITEQGIEVQNNYDEFWSYSEQDGIGYLKLGTFAAWQFSFDWEEFLYDVFLGLKTSEVESLIIDLRGNSGGLGEVRDKLLSYIVKEKVTYPSIDTYSIYRKVPKEWQSILQTYNPAMYNLAWKTRLNLEGKRVRIFAGQRGSTIKPDKNAFEGRVAILVDASNSSATYQMSALLQKHKLATLIGGETGGSSRGITGGQYFFIELPNTKVEVDIPLIAYHTGITEDVPIYPDIMVKQSLTDVINGVDRVRMVAEQWLQTQNQ